MTNSDSGTDITIEELRSFDFKRVLSKQRDDSDRTERWTCLNYSKNFVEESKLAVSEGDQKREMICELFATLTSSWFYFDDDVPEPFPPPDIDKDHLELLKQYANEITDPELKARIADILWYLRIDKAFLFAEFAVDAYLDSATRFDRVEAYSDRTRRIDRALQIAAALGRKGRIYTTTIAFIEAELREMQEANILYGPADLLRLLREHRQGEPAIYIPYATHLAEEFEKKDSWEGARAVWYIARDWHRFAEDDEGARCAERRAAMTYEPEAIAWMKHDAAQTHVRVIHLLEKGVVALRESGAPQDDIKRVHNLMLKTQASYDDYKTFSFNVDMSEPIESTKREFREQTLADCIFRLAVIIGPSSVDSLKTQANDLQTKNTLQYLFTKHLVDSQGKKIGQRPGYTDNDDNSIDQSIRITMHEEAKRRQQVIVIGMILPALEQINLDHHIRPNDLIEIVTNSPFIPPNRREIFLRGLYHGFTLDFMVASSLLVPQIENSLRYVLQQRGVIVSKLDSEGIQEEYSLRRLLYEIPEVREFFGEDLLFDLQGLLHERFGSNFRNRLAHGLVTDSEFLHSGASVYAWWLVLYLCCAPLHARQAAAQNNDTLNDDNQKADDETPDSKLA